MTRPKRASAAPGNKAVETRQALLDAAATLFSGKGFAATTISDIASEAGVNRSLVSYHFGGKAGLYDALLQSAVDEAAAALKRNPVDPAAPDPERALVRAFAEAYAAQPHLAFMLIREHLEPAYLTDARSAGKLRGFIALTKQALEAGRLSPEAERFDPQVVHLIIVGALIYFLVTRPYRERMRDVLDSPPTRPSVEEFTDTLAHILSKGLRG